MSSIIQLLPDHVANQIAAGEVVQRPASVVKELLENAVDAKASDIKLIIKNAGKTLVQVIDNGLGMSITDSRLCFERHATSKIRLAEDLFALHTKGFRGEALASIAAIAHVELKTKQDHEELGTHIVIEGSKFMSQDVAVLPKGTSFLVKNLFFNIPARRNFLKSDTVEYRNIMDEFQRVALAHSTICFSLYHNGSEMFNLPQSNLRQRIVNIFGQKTNEKLVPIEELTEIVKVNGFVGKPEYAKKSRSEQFFFVNNRYIKSGYLHHAVMAAFDGLLPAGNQPSYFIYLDVPPNTIDINIHPTKTEIKFDDENAIYSILRSIIKHSLGQFSIAPVLDFNRDATLDMPYNFRNLEVAIPKVDVDKSFNPFENQKPYRQEPKIYATNQNNSWESLYVDLKKDTESVLDKNNFQFETETINSSLFDGLDIEKAKHVTYQLNRKYIINPIKSGMVIIDQNRAHQRVLYEQFLTNITVKKADSQQLLFPLQLFYSKNEVQLLNELKIALQNTGFVFEEINQDNVIVSGFPINTSEQQVTVLLDKLIQDLHTGVPDNNYSQNDTIAKSMAYSLAIKNGSYLSEIEQENLINSLFACKDPNVSPNQKPTFVTMNVDDIDKKFAI